MLTGLIVYVVIGMLYGAAINDVRKPEAKAILFGALFGPICLVYGLMIVSAKEIFKD